MKMRNPVDIAIGSKVRRLRQRAHLTDVDLAALLKIEAAELIRIEHGHARVGSHLLDDIARLFGVPVWSFFDRADDQPGDDEGEGLAPRPRSRSTLH